MSRLPPGQIETGRFPIVGERRPSSDLAGDPDNWQMEISGLVDEPITLNLDQVHRLGTSSVKFDIHCVTSWTRYDSTFTGIRLSDLIRDVEVADNARFVSFEAYSDRDHHTSLPLAVALDSTWVVHSFAGEPLTTEHGGPVRTVTPGRYFYKSVKWLKAIRLLESDRLGWWEENSFYHNNADPSTGRERFTTGSLRPEQVERFLEADRYDKYRGRVLLGLDLRSWKPKSSDLRRLYLKDCDLRGVDLRGADLRGANLSMSDLRGANLARADFTGSDLEGANLAGADVSAADLSDTALSATRFFDAEAEAVVSRMTMRGSWGLLESQEEFLVSRGVATVEGAG